MRLLRGIVLKTLLLLLSAGGTMAVAQETTPIPYDHNPPAGKFYDINGFKMYTDVYDVGRGNEFSPLATGPL